MTELPKRFLIDSLKGHLQNLNNIPEERKSGVIHPSELHSCARKAWYCLMHTKKEGSVPPDLRLIFDTGHYLHDMLGTYYTDLFGKAAILEIEAEDTDLELCGHADIMIWGENRPEGVEDYIPGMPSFGVELKTCKSEVFSRPPLSGSSNPHPHTAHIWQAHCYMHCTQVLQWRLLYYNKNDSRMKEFVVDFDNELWSEIYMKISRIRIARDDGVPPAGETGYQCRNCPYKWTCEEAPEEKKSWRKTGSQRSLTRSR